MYWNPNKDFGKGFYTTIDLPQAQDWAISRMEKFGEDPCVLQMYVDVNAVPEGLTHHVFFGPSLEWATYINNHRSNQTEQDPCYESDHAQIVSGPMADNDTGRTLETRIDEQKGVSWFYMEIMKSKEGDPLGGLGLGNQIAFSDLPIAKRMLRLHGAWLINDEGSWEYHEHATLRSL